MTTIQTESIALEAVVGQPIKHPVVMGILNVTPDSFSDGGDFASPEAAIRYAHELALDGADIIDVGGESTRPGSRPVSADEQWRRIGDVVRSLVDSNLLVSVDTRSAHVARLALDAGATLINDVSAGTDDPALLDVVASAGAGIVLMHKQGRPQTMQARPSYSSCTSEVIEYLLERAQTACASGIPAGHIWIDPGIGFGKTLDHNLELLQNTDQLVDTGYRVMLGVSRKSFIDKLFCAGVEKRLGGSLASLVPAFRSGVSGYRVHDVQITRQFLDLLGTLGESK